MEEPNYGSSSRAVSRQSTDEPRYIRITDFGEDGIPEGHEYVTADGDPSRYWLQADDLLFARSGATVGKTYIHEDVSEPAIFAGYCIRFRFNLDLVLPHFVYWWTKTQAYAKWVATIQRPSGQPNINKEEFKSCLIPLPENIQQQDDLVFLMTTARTAYRAKLDEADKLLSSLDQFLLDALGLPAPPRDDRRVYAVIRQDVISTSKLGPDYYHPERVLTIRELRALTGDVKAAPLRALVHFPHQIVRTPGDVYLSLSHVRSNTGELSDSTDTATGTCILFQENDVLFAGLRPYLNKVYRAEMNGTCSPEFYVLRVRDAETLLPDYLAAVLRSKLVLAQTMHMMTGNTHPRLAEDDVETLMVPVAPPDVQRTIADEIHRRRTEARRLRAEAAAEWAVAKQRFEDALLDPQAPPL